MFDVGFSEMIVIGIVALIVIGPEKLPKVARTIGLLVGRMQRYVGNVKSDIQREMQFEDLQKLQQEIKQGLTDTQHEVMETGAGIKKEVAALERDIESAVTGGSSLHATLGNSASAVQSELDLSVSQDASASDTEPEPEPVIQPELASEESQPEIAALESAPPWPVPESQVLPAAEQLHAYDVPADAAEPSIQASPGTTSITGTSSITGTTADPDATRTST